MSGRRIKVCFKFLDKYSGIALNSILFCHSDRATPYRSTGQALGANGGICEPPFQVYMKKPIYKNNRKNLERGERIKCVSEDIF